MMPQQRMQFAQQTQAMIDGLNIPEEQKNVLRNLNGFSYHVGNMQHVNMTYSQRGLASPLAQIGSTLNCNFSQDVSVMPEVFSPTPIGRQFRMAVYPLAGYISLNQHLTVNTLTKPQARALCPLLTIDDLDNMITTIITWTGFAYCSLVNCPASSNLQGVVFTYNGEECKVVGVAVMCRGHCQGSQRVLTVQKGSPVYLFVNNIQQSLLA